jgi:hypothetical protein
MIKGETVFSGAPHPGTELEILSTPAGYYLGFRDEEGFPYSRESQYFMYHEYAEAALKLTKAVIEEGGDPSTLYFMRNDNFNR